MDLKDLKEYTRIKKIDIKKWLLRGHASIYALILILFTAAVIFMFSTIRSMLNNEIPTNDVLTEENSEKESTGYVADNESYMLAINKVKNYLVVYKMDSTGNFTEIFQVFRCSVPEKMQVGETFVTDKFIWKIFDENVYGHYAVQFGNNSYIHSVLYSQQDVTSLIADSYNNLGNASEAGGIALAAADSKWIYENCGLNTKVKVYEDSSEDLDSHLAEFSTLAHDTQFDPTDKEAVNNIQNNVVNTKIDYMTGTRDCTIALNSDFNIWTGVYAKDINGNDITSYITATGSVDTSISGVYQVIYYLNDSFGTNLKYYRYVTVTEKDENMTDSQTETTGRYPTPGAEITAAQPTTAVEEVLTTASDTSSTDSNNTTNNTNSNNNAVENSSTVRAD